MSLVNPDALKALNEFVRRVYVEGQDPKAVVSDMLRGGRLKMYEVMILAKSPYQYPVQVVLSNGRAEDVITFFDVFTGQYKLGGAPKAQPGPDHHYTVKTTNIEVGKLVLGDVEYRFLSFTPISIVGKVQIVGRELLFKARRGFIEPYIVIVDVVQPPINEVPIEQVFKALPMGVGENPKKNLIVLHSIFAPQIIGQGNAKTALFLSAVGAGPSIEDRPTVHAMLVGNASTGKTTLAYEMHRVWPKSAIIEVTHSTETSMVVAYVPDEGGHSGGLMVGPLPLLHGDYFDFGIAFLNEAQNLKEPQKLIPILDGSEISITKAGRSIKVRAQVSMVFLMNPVLDSWDPSNPMANFPRNFSSAFLSRIDVIAVLYPPSGEEEVREVTRVIREKYRGLRTDYAVLRSIIRYARSLNPKERSDVEKYVEDVIVDLYNKYSSKGLPFLPRTIEAVMRLIYAFARLTLQPEITKETVDFAAENIKSWLDAMSNPALGMIMTGSDKKNAMLLLETMKTDCTI
jgi:MoxR-like ATPase